MQRLSWLDWVWAQKAEVKSQRCGKSSKKDRFSLAISPLLKEQGTAMFHHSMLQRNAKGSI